MKAHTSEWFGSLTTRERKDLVCLLFAVRSKVKQEAHFALFDRFLNVLDQEYHALK